MHKPLTVAMPVGLADIIAAHKAIFGETVMMADDAKAEETPKKGEGAKPDKSDDQLGESGMKALHAEREARKALEREVAELKEAKASWDKVSEVFGKDGAKPDTLTDLATQVAEMKRRIEAEDERKARDALARSVAKASDLSDIDDIALIANQPDEAAMKVLAERLAKAKSPGTPKPDRSAGRGGGDGSKVATVQAGRDLYRDMHPDTHK